MSDQFYLKIDRIIPLCIKDPLDDHGDGVIKVATLKIETEYDVFHIYIDRCGLYGINFYLDKNSKRQTSEYLENKINSMSFDEIVTLHQMLGDVINEKIESACITAEISDNFSRWADETYAEGVYTNLNHRLLIGDIYQDFLMKNPEEKLSSVQKFRKAMRAWCSLRGYKFNPHLFTEDGRCKLTDKVGLPTDRDLEGGKEYITIGNERFQYPIQVYRLNEKKGGQP